MQSDVVPQHGGPQRRVRGAGQARRPAMVLSLVRGPGVWKPGRPAAGQPLRGLLERGPPPSQLPELLEQQKYTVTDYAGASAPWPSSASLASRPPAQLAASAVVSEPWARPRRVSPPFARQHLTFPVSWGAPGQAWRPCDLSPRGSPVGTRQEHSLSSKSPGF